MPTNGHATMLAAARKYLDLGWALVPCQPRSKKPMVQGWQKRRLTWEEIEAALTLYPDANLAVNLALSNLIDIECDSAEAPENLREMYGGEIPETPTFPSPRGLHRIGLWSANLPDKAKIEIDGIEFRGLSPLKGALSMLPPSIHPNGTKYEWLPGLSPFEIEPVALLEDIAERLRETKKQPKAKSPEDGVIPEGKRNDELFKLACRLADTGLTYDSVLAALLAENAAKCVPPLPDSEVESIVKSAFAREAQGTKKQETAADVLLSLVDEAGVEFWHTPDVTPYATIENDGHNEHFPVRSSLFREWLSRLFYSRTGRAPHSQGLQDAISVLSARAKFDGAEYPVYMRTARHGDKIYIDLCDDEWRAIEIDENGWRIVSNPPVRFRRTKGMRPLAEPKKGGSFADLRPFVNVSDEHWPLLLAWIVMAFRPDGPFPVLKLIAEQGSGKTLLCRLLRELIDPNIAAVRSAPSNERDLMIAANNSWMISWDNLSFISPELSDGVCRLASGGAFATRKLYADDEEILFTAQRPIVCNSIEDIGTRSDLLDRSLMVELPRIEPGDRKAESVFWREFEQAKPKILGAILSAVSTALKRLPQLDPADYELPRMADFALWSIAAEPALGLRDGEFLSAYLANRQSANQTALESSPVVRALYDLLKKRHGEFEGTATELHNDLAVGQDTKAKSWPKNARTLSGILDRLAPNLRAAGYTIERDTRGTRENKKKIWILKSPPVEDSAETTKSNNRVTADSLKASLRGNR